MPPLANFPPPPALTSLFPTPSRFFHDPFSYVRTISCTHPCLRTSALVERQEKSSDKCSFESATTERIRLRDSIAHDIGPIIEGRRRTVLG